jgi:hypothetical protein
MDARFIVEANCWPFARVRVSFGCSAGPTVAGSRARRADNDSQKRLTISPLKPISFQKDNEDSFKP